MNDTPPERIRLADGAEVLIRPMKPEDTDRLFSFYRALPEEDRFYLDDDVTRRDVFDRYLEDLRSGIVYAILAEQDGVILGHGTLERTRHGWTAHVGEIRTVVARASQRSGIGTALVRRLVRQGITWGLDKMVALTMDNQTGARRAFEKIGFRPEAVLKKHVKDVSGVSRDLVVMSNDVSHLWQTMETLVSDYSPSLE